jgi:polar amino acid transport system substrate-binding protein
VLASSSFAGKQTVVLATGDTASPPNILGTGETFPEQNPGVLVEVLQQVARELDIQIVFKRYPYLRAIYYTETGEVDGFFTWSYKENRTGQVCYPMVGNKPDVAKRIRMASYAFYTLKGSDVKWDGKNLSNIHMPIGTCRKCSIASLLKKKYNVDVEDATNSLYKSLDKLLAGRLSAVVDLEIPTDIVISSNNKYNDRIVKMSPLLVEKPYYLVLNKKFVREHPVLAGKIWTTLAKVREKNMLTIMQKYIR